MKLKKWLLGLVTFAAMAVVCAVAAGAENYHAYIGFQTGPYSFRNSFDEANYGKDVENGKYFNGVVVWGDNDPKTYPQYEDYYDYDIDGYVLPATYTDATISKDGTYKVGISDFDWALDGASGFNLLFISTDLPFDKNAGESVAKFSNAKIIVDGKVTAEIANPMINTEYGMKSGYTEVLFAYIWNMDLDSYAGAYPTKSLEIQFDVSIPWVTDYEYSLLDDGTVEITKYTGSESDVVIPDEIYGKKVTSIGDFAFSDNARLTSIKIPDSVTRIGNFAFLNCTSLVSVLIPDYVISIGDSAFSENIDLVSITIPDSVTQIGNYAFHGCKSLTEINVAPENQYYSSENGVLFDKNQVEIIHYPAGITNTSYCIPDSVQIIGNHAFKDCANLINITIPNGITSIGESAFYGCSSIKNVTIPDSMTNISDYAFFGCVKLISITMHDRVTNIGEYAFGECASLKNITIPDSITKIGQRAFVSCTSLTSIVIPNDVTYIGEYAFFGCTSLVTIDVNASNKNYTSVNGILFNKDKTEIICYPPNKKDKSYNIPVGVTSISNGTFRDCSNLISIIMPYSVKKIGYTAFNNCTNLTSITIPNGITKICGWTFNGCISLNSVKIPDSVTEIGNSAFYCCDSLKSLTIPRGVTQIGSYAIGFVGLENKTDGFKIYCYSNTAGEKYAKNNGFDYELITAKKPAKVTGFKVKSIFSTNVTLQWNKGTTASGYQLQQYKDGKWVTIYTGTKATDTSYTVKKLKAGTAGYRFRIRAYKTYGNTKQYGSWSGEVKVNTNPYGVGGFKCSSKTSTSVTLKWNKGTTASGYQLQQYKNGKWVTIYTGTKATNTSYTVKGLKAGTAGYRFRIRAYKTYGNTKQYGSWNSEVKVNTNPYGVGGFKCSSKSSTSVTLKWNKGTTASGYQLQQYKNGKWVTIYTGTKATNTSYTVKKLKAGTAGYRFRIRAYKTYGNTKQYGSWSSEVKVNTNPYGVGGFKAKSTAKTSITLGWNKGTTASGYQLQQYKGGKWVTVYTGTKATSTSYTVKSLKANTSYKFRIRAYKTYGNTKQYGSWGKVLTVKTKR